MNQRATKNLSIDKICDIYLKELYIEEERNIKVPFINDVLDKKRIYYDEKIIAEVIKKLEEEKFIEPIPQSFSIFSYAKRELKNRSSSIMGLPTMDELLQNAAGTVSQYKLTSKGRHFVFNKQRIDTTRVDAVNEIINRIKSNKYLAPIIAIGIITTAVLTFYDKVKPYLKLATSQSDVSVKLPVETGWIFGGYYNYSIKKFIKGPFFKVIQSPYPDKRDIPRVGEIIKIIEDREIVISNFKTEGLTNIYDPPWKQNTLEDDDYTGIIIQEGEIVEVRDESSGHFPDNGNFAIWLRVGGKGK